MSWNNLATMRFHGHFIVQFYNITAPYGTFAAHKELFCLSFVITREVKAQPQDWSSVNRAINNIRLLLHMKRKIIS